MFIRSYRLPYLFKGMLTFSYKKTGIYKNIPIGKPLIYLNKCILKREGLKVKLLRNNYLCLLPTVLLCAPKVFR